MVGTSTMTGKSMPDTPAITNKLSTAPAPGVDRLGVRIQASPIPRFFPTGMRGAGTTGWNLLHFSGKPIKK